LYGVACDIGTTTVVAKLLDLATGELAATSATVNPQARHGHDVISRISHASSDQGLAELQRLIVEAINGLLADLCRQAGIDSRQVVQVCAVGNTTMNHLLLGLPVRQLGQAPYAAYSLDGHDVQAAGLGIRIHPAGVVHTVENIAGFLGSDTTAVGIAADVGNLGVTTLVLDIGTNGELLLEARGKVSAASCAAGPAFEGARITQGSRAVMGAIERVDLSGGDLEIGVIGGASPRSICGSGLVDAVAAMLDLGVLDATGRMAGPGRCPPGLAAAIESRVLEVEGSPAFCLASDPKAGRPAVVLTQADIRQVQLAKAAIRSGIEILLRRNDLAVGDISRVLMAGAFGNTIRPQGAIRIGLLPELPPDHVVSIGNAACAGAEMILINRHCRAAAGRLARSIDHVEIALDPEFEQIYADAMSFPSRSDSPGGDRRPAGDR
jgi:uncharacterized 2Fe-2S/4Fe-4S cluster protein (DUF4445 family)